ncbi:hypothetical protein Pyn_37654 [Prunus yedoensis var. nudiflora]|uniref:Uncharacterized protein n=1 Tax=Prunus yedoensis var. nudiflora TaxID=2094558 RepID=A0A314ZII7_PRUYE|nr:hypothetical protein Pyn_37654 [Prunus yedoensis var. nudiflora]
MDTGVSREVGGGSDPVGWAWKGNRKAHSEAGRAPPWPHHSGSEVPSLRVKGFTEKDSNISRKIHSSSYERYNLSYI